MKWFKKKKTPEEDPEGGPAQKSTAEQSDDESTEDEPRDEAPTAVPKKKGFFRRLGRKTTDTDAEHSPPRDALPQPPEDLPEPDEAEEFKEEPLPGDERERGFLRKLRKKKGDTPSEAPPTDETAATPEPDETQAVEEGPDEEGLPKRGLFLRLKDRLSKTRKAFTSRLDTLVLGKREIDEALLEELEEILITSDIGVQTTMALIDHVREGVERKDLEDPAQLKQALQDQILSFLKVPSPAVKTPSGKPHIIMVVGVNGVGKTTTIGKLSDRYVREGKHVLLIAADTFRAAAVEQLEIWGERVGAEIIRHNEHEKKSDAKVDPSAVVYDGMQAATSRNVDVVIIDTAGRLHTKVNLMEQLKKIRRTVARHVPDAPHEILLVLDATTGQNAISQAQLFHEALDVTGIALTKLDGTAKGGIVVGISHSLELPIQYIGIGEKRNDLQDFDPDAFAEALF
jgi:fused signal recognition particle receptor